MDGWIIGVVAGLVAGVAESRGGVGRFHYLLLARRSFSSSSREVPSAETAAASGKK